MSTKVLEASPESGKRNDPFSSAGPNIFVPGALKNVRIGGTSCGLSVVVESDHAQTLPLDSVDAGGGIAGAAGSGRKRHQSTSKPAGQIKRRRKTYERNGSKPKFLLGGCITDPLNLNSLDDEEISKIANAVTPACSPLPEINKDPDPVIVPQDFKDPLKLNIADDSPENNSSLTKTLVSRKSSGKKKKYHNSGEAKRDSIESLLGNSDRDGEGGLCSRPLWLDLQDNKTAKLANKIVSPVLPDSRGRKRKASRTEPSSRLAKALLIDDLVPLPKLKAKSNEPDEKDRERLMKRARKSPEAISKFKRQHSHDAKPAKPKFREKDQKFQYGNYARYYGYRTPDSDDNRLEHFKREWFEGKKCLDIGCNSGHVTLAVAKFFNPSSIVGVDIDGNLIGTARKNVKLCLEEQFREKKGKGRVQYPVSLQKTYGPLGALGPGGSPSASYPSFPANVLFRCANFVLEKDSLLDTQKEEYDTILCLSITKWIHLNWGDAGIKRFFKRIFRALHPGGRLILEPQLWKSYQKKKKITETTYNNYKEIRFKPHQFKDYLLSQEIGFATCEVIGTPLNKSKGFRRPLVMFTKLSSSSRPVSRRPSTEKLPSTAVISTLPSATAKPGTAPSYRKEPSTQEEGGKEEGRDERKMEREEEKEDHVFVAPDALLMKQASSSSATEEPSDAKERQGVKRKYDESIEKLKEESIEKKEEQKEEDDISSTTDQLLVKQAVSSTTSQTAESPSKERHGIKRKHDESSKEVKEELKGEKEEGDDVSRGVTTEGSSSSQEKQGVKRNLDEEPIAETEIGEEQNKKMKEEEAKEMEGKNDELKSATEMPREKKEDLSVDCKQEEDKKST